MSRPPRGWTGPHVESQDPRAEELLRAARSAEADRVLTLLDAGVDIDARDSIGWTALMMATHGRHLDLMGELIARGANLDFENSFYFTALTLAAIESCARRRRPPDRRPFDLLLAAGACLTLHEAIYLDDLDLARRRLEAGDDPDTAEGSYHGPVLTTAGDAGNVALVDLLLDFGANIEATDDLGRRPLLSAAHHGQAEVVHRLLDRGANLDGRDWSGQTALSEAASGGHLDLARWLIDRGAKRGIIDALLLGDEPLFTRLLDEKLVDGGDIDDLSDGRHRLATVAVRHGDPTFVRLLLDRGARHVRLFHSSDSLLTEAARHGQLAVMRLLLDRGADLHALGHDGLTPLAWATRENQAEAAALLCQAGATR